MSFRPGEVWLDNNGARINAHGGGILLYDGVYYWFGEHRVGPGGSNPFGIGVHVYSSRDLYNWRDEGAALLLDKDPDSVIHRNCILERPKVLFNAKTGKFVMWFHVELNDQRKRGYGAAYAGVAVADAPTGPYVLQRAGRLDAGKLPTTRTSDGTIRPLSSVDEAHNARFFLRDFETGQMSRDCTLFLDDDGKAYFITSSEENQRLHFHLLNDEFTDSTGTYARFSADRSDVANEAPAVFKKDGKYYLIASGTTGWRPNPARLFVSDSIWGPWTYLGNPCHGDEHQVATTFESQANFVLPAPGRPAQFIYLGDRWRPGDLTDSRYIWLPIEWEEGQPVLRWRDAWNLSVFGASGK